MIGSNVTVTSSPAGPYASKQAFRVEETPEGLKVQETTIYQGSPESPWYTDEACLCQDSRMHLFGDTHDEALRLALADYEYRKAEFECNARRAQNRCRQVIDMIRESIQRDLLSRGVVDSV